MKNLFFCLIATITMQGQVILEHSYNTSIFPRSRNAFKTDNGLNYFTLDNVNNILRIYDATHTLIKTTNIVTPTNYSILDMSYISDKLFNADSQIEFLIRFYRNVSAPNTLDINVLTLINENGTVLQQFGNRESAEVIKGNGTNLKLIVIAPSNSGNYIYDVYGLSGTLSTVQFKNINLSLTSYPNPAKNEMTITNFELDGNKSKLEVFDINGKRVIERNIKENENEIILELSDFPKGVYIYKINGQTNKFVKN